MENFESSYARSLVQKNSTRLSQLDLIGERAYQIKNSFAIYSGPLLKEEFESFESKDLEDSHLTLDFLECFQQVPKNVLNPAQKFSDFVTLAETYSRQGIRTYNAICKRDTPSPCFIQFMETMKDQLKVSSLHPKILSDYETQYPRKGARFCSSFSDPAHARRMILPQPTTTRPQADKNPHDFPEKDYLAAQKENTPPAILQTQQKKWAYSRYGGESVQNNYQLSTLNTIFEAANLIRENHWVFFEALEFFAQKRNQLAYLTETHDAALFGSPRVQYDLSGASRLTTQLQHTYAYKLPACDRLFKNNPDATQTHSLTIQYQQGSTTYPLSILTHSSPESCQIEHTRVSVLPEFLEKVVAAQYNKIVHRHYSKSETRELLLDVGRFHWMLVQATPYKRGSAAISENITRALLVLHHRKLLPYSPGIVPDLEALLTPEIEDFARFYADSMFQ